MADSTEHHKQELSDHLLKCANEYAEEAAECEKRAAHFRQRAVELRDRVANL